MKEKAEKAGFRPGVMVKVIFNPSDSRSRRRLLYKGEILAMYKHIFTVRRGEYIESFRYDQIFADEDVRVTL